MRGEDEFVTYEEAQALLGGMTPGALNKFLGRHRVVRYVRRADVEQAMQDAPGSGRWGPRIGEESPRERAGREFRKLHE